jgi:hypothetical protein
MRRKLRDFGMMTLVLGAAALGCTRSALQHKDPGDPLLQTKKPVEGLQRLGEGDPNPEVPLPPPLPVRDLSALSVHGQGFEPARPILLGVEPAGAPGTASVGPTGR